MSFADSLHNVNMFTFCVKVLEPIGDFEYEEIEITRSVIGSNERYCEKLIIEELMQEYLDKGIILEETDIGIEYLIEKI